MAVETETNQPATRPEILDQSLIEALEQSPENLPLHLVYARRCEEALSWTEARTTYEAVLKNFPNHPSAQLGIARTQFFQGCISEAEVRVESLLRKHPNFAEGHLFLCRVLCSDSDCDLQRAVKHYRAALEIDKNLAEPALDRDLGALVRQAEAAEGQAEEPKAVDGNADPFGDDWLPFSGEVEIESPFELEKPEEDTTSDYVDGGFIDALQQGLEQNGIRISDLDTTPTNFSDVGGLYGLKEDLRMKIVHPIKNPQLYKSYGIGAGGSMLLYGPPGCGKTMIAEALHGEVNAQLYTIGLHQLFGGKSGNPETELNEIFHIAKMNAPSVLFLDDVDAIAAHRGVGSSLVNQLLKELDNLKKGDDSVLVVAATSAPWLLDRAFLRAGRFDRKVCVDAPGESDRVDIIRVLRNRIPVSDLDAEKIAAATEGFSGAELTAVFENAAERAVGASLQAGMYEPLTTDLVLAESKALEPAAGSWLAQAQEELKKQQMQNLFRDLFE